MVTWQFEPMKFETKRSIYSKDNPQRLMAIHISLGFVYAAQTVCWRSKIYTKTGSKSDYTYSDGL